MFYPAIRSDIIYESPKGVYLVLSILLFVLTYLNVINHCHDLVAYVSLIKQITLLEVGNHCTVSHDIVFWVCRRVRVHVRVCVCCVYLLCVRVYVQLCVLAHACMCV